MVRSMMPSSRARRNSEKEPLSGPNLSLGGGRVR